MRRVVVSNDTPHDLWVQEATGTLLVIKPGDWKWVWAIDVE